VYVASYSIRQKIIFLAHFTVHDRQPTELIQELLLFLTDKSDLFWMCRAAERHLERLSVVRQIDMLLCGSDMKPEHWAEMCKMNDWNNVELRDGRYNQVIHMVSAAKGAEQFYDNQNHVTRHESLELARQLDDLTAQVWAGNFDFTLVIKSSFCITCIRLW